MKKVLTVLLVLTLLLVSLSSCMKATPKEFASNGMTITLTNAFREKSVEGYTVCYDSAKVAVLALKESFSLLQGFENFTLDQYAHMVREANAAKAPGEIFEVEGLVAMEYTFFNESEKQDFKYFCTMFKGTDAFWLVQFACKTQDYDNYKNSFVEWAKTISFNG